MAVAAPERFRLAALPTPLLRALRLEEILGVSPIYVKRDDLTGFSLAGNKARKLELIVADAILQGADTIVTGGGPGSNHCQATAVATAVAGLQCHLVLYGDEPESRTANLSIARACRSAVTFTGSPERSSVDAAFDGVLQGLRNEGRRPYLVPRGGATPLGAAAYALAAFELADQLESEDVATATIVLATGSCGTQAGLVAGRAIRDLQWRVVGASVSRPPDECTKRVARLAAGAAEVLGSSRPAGSDIELVDARGPGYGEPSSAAEDAALLCLRSEGLLLDPTFTAKAFAALLRLVEEGCKGPIVFLHTGGTPAAVEWISRIVSERGAAQSDG